MSSRRIWQTRRDALVLVAKRHIKDIENADEQEDTLLKKLWRAKTEQEIYAPEDPPQQGAVLALRFEAMGDWGAALASWQDILKQTNKDARRSWIYLAKRKASQNTAKLKEIADKEEDKDEKKVRLDALDAKFTEASKKARETPVAARYMCKEILDLYGKDKDPDVVKRLCAVRKVQASLPKGTTGA